MDVFQCKDRDLMCFHQDSDLLDRRKHCFTVQSESGEDLYFSVELESDLAQWERAFQTATFLEVERIQPTHQVCKTYACVLESHLMGLTIDFSTGFICFDAATKAGYVGGLLAVHRRGENPDTNVLVDIPVYFCWMFWE
ncbi:Gamma-1-syntrophin [Saguinus oedipus]|uniref:Gamma-1-syntrophin n=1 Tax=Saguinus oedipus TaxID=9490 RepID=A0ABQ9UDH1_SAGOE|nr:Gamma-1-syntrophin [Saguinus oedipus]